MSEAARTAVIDGHCKALRMPSVRRDYEPLARQANDGGWPYQDYLRELLEAEIRSRHERAVQRRINCIDRDGGCVSTMVC